MKKEREVEAEGEDETTWEANGEKSMIPNRRYAIHPIPVEIRDWTCSTLVF